MNRPSFPCYLTVFENRSINHKQPVESRSTNLARGPSKWTVRKKLQIMINLIVFRTQVRLPTLAGPVEMCERPGAPSLSDGPCEYWAVVWSCVTNDDTPPLKLSVITGSLPV